jgi:Mlc titration factor MtfA (ptsG expression regulator)
MAHAYYYQYFETGMKADPVFTDKFPSFSTVGDRVLQAEKKKDNTFYSAYGLSNLSEFWAESVELFFERPAQFKEIYPVLYATMVTLLNQDPGQTYL